MDREKVIKGLEKLRKDLGYGLPDRSDVVMEYLNSLTDAIAMLKEQDAETVIKIAKRFSDCDLTGYCPFCSRPLIKDWAENYCGYCGRPVLWEGR